MKDPSTKQLQETIDSLRQQLENQQQENAKTLQKVRQKAQETEFNLEQMVERLRNWIKDQQQEHEQALFLFKQTNAAETRQLRETITEVRRRLSEVQSESEHSSANEQLLAEADRRQLQSTMQKLRSAFESLEEEKKKLAQERDDLRTTRLQRKYAVSVLCYSWKTLLSQRGVFIEIGGLIQKKSAQFVLHLAELGQSPSGHENNSSAC